MKVFFLEADRPLTKTFTRRPDGTLDKSSYPIVSEFTSHEEDVTDIHGFYEAVQRHAALGHCLLKGQLQAPLVSQSRAGSTSALDPTQWLCIDFDNLEGIVSAEAAIEFIFPEFRNATYILQHSASAGISGELGLRAHLFFMLDEPVLPEALKLWFTQLNLTAVHLQKNLALSSNGLTLKFALDRTVAQNDKLLYIAPPELVGGIDDPLAGQRIKLVTKTQNTITLPSPEKLWNAAKIQLEVRKHVTALRKEAGLKDVTPKYKTLGNDEILANPDPGMVVGEKQDRQWTRINVQGESPSWAYYYNTENPKLLYNFKGQPNVLLQDFLPDYYKELVKRGEQRRIAQAAEAKIRPFVFRDMRTDQFYNGLFDTQNQKLIDVSPTRGDARRLQFFFGQYGEQPPVIIEDWTYEFRPQDDRLIDFERKFLNQWVPTVLMVDPPQSNTVPPLIARVLLHVVGDDIDCYNHLLNWLACAYQHRKKLLTAWVLHGIEGTGKGTLFTRILQPIFGRKHSLEMKIQDLEDQFNAEFEQALICVLDETKADAARNVAAVMGKLKNFITEPQVRIRGMQRNGRMAQSFVNFFLFSNNLDAIEIASTDRRFNVAVRQERSLLQALTEQLGRPVTDKDFDYIEEVEAPLFAGFLKQFNADLTRAQRALDNAPKRQMRLASMDPLEQILEAIREGNLEFFLTFLEDGSINPETPYTFQAYQAIVSDWVNKVGVKSVITTREIQTVYVYLFAPPRIPGPHKFSKMLANKQVDMKQHAYDAASQNNKRGLQTTWKLDPALVEAFKQSQEKPVVRADRAA